MSVNLTTPEASETNPRNSETRGLRRTACVNTTSFLIGRNSKGQWIVRERNGLYGGLFVSQANAIRYAMFESGHRADAITLVSGIVELEMSAASYRDLPIAPAVFPDLARQAA